VCGRILAVGTSEDTEELVSDVFVELRRVRNIIDLETGGPKLPIL
jgi:hypothetical protein